MTDTLSTPWSYRVHVALVREGNRRTAPVVHDAVSVANVARQLGMHDRDREVFLVLHLDVKNRVISHEVMGVGHLTSALVHPREVFKAAILANAAAVVVVHNHPSGDPEPSREDAELMRRLMRAGQLLGIPVLDHVVIGDDRHVSLAERGELS